MEGGGDAHFSVQLRVKPRPVLCDVHDNQQEMEGLSASAKGLRRFSDPDNRQNAHAPADMPAEPNRQTWCIVECGHLNSLSSDVKCSLVGGRTCNNSCWRFHGLVPRVSALL